MENLAFCPTPLQCSAIHDMATNLSEVNSKLTTVLGLVQIFFQSWKDEKQQSLQPQEAVQPQPVPVFINRQQGEPTKIPLDNHQSPSTATAEVPSVKIEPVDGDEYEAGVAPAVRAESLPDDSMFSDFRNASATAFGLPVPVDHTISSVEVKGHGVFQSHSSLDDQYSQMQPSTSDGRFFEPDGSSFGETTKQSKRVRIRKVRSRPRHSMTMKLPTVVVSQAWSPRVR